jgi:hypothetical protein
MFSLRHCIPLACASALLACGSDSRVADPLSPRFAAGQLSTSPSGPSASGHASVIQQPSGALRTFSFHARVMPDGSVQGEYDNHNRQAGFVNHGDIDCLRLIGTNGAVMGGPSRRSDNPAAGPGSRVIFRVEDNGEGAGDVPDRVSLLFLFPPGSTEDCQIFTPPNTSPIEGGNIQVRP